MKDPVDLCGFFFVDIKPSFVFFMFQIQYMSKYINISSALVSLLV